MRKAILQYPLLLPLLAYGGGIYAASKIELHYFQIQTLLFLILGLGLGIYCFFKSLKIEVRLFETQKSTHGFILKNVGIILIAGIVGMLRLQDHFFRPLPETLQNWIEQEKPIPVLFQPLNFCRSKDFNDQIDIEVLGGFEAEKFQDFRFKTQLSLPPAFCPLRFGNVYRGALRFRLPQRFRNFSSWDYGRYLKTRDITVLASLKNDLKLVEAASFDLSEKLGIQNLRQSLFEILQKQVAEDWLRGFEATFLLGEKKDFDPGLEEAFRRTGLTHLIVVSGLHFVLLSLCFYFPIYGLLSLKKAWANSGIAQNIATAFSLLPALFFAGLVGWTPSVHRALEAMLLSFLVLTFRLKKDFFSLLIVIAFFLLLMEPLFLFDLSFQLSFLSVAAVNFSWRRFYLVFSHDSQPQFYSSLLKKILLSLYCSVGVHLALYPLIVSSFHEVSTVSPLTNLIFVPLFSLLLPALLLAIALSVLMPQVGDFAFWILNESTRPMLQSIQWLGLQRWSSSLVASWNYFDWMIYLMALAIFWGFIRKSKINFIVFLILLAQFGQVLSQTWLSPKNLQLTLLDVGQGDSLLLQLAHREMIVIDGGGFSRSRFDLGRNVVAPALLERGYKKLRAVVMTHPDRDHYQGLEFLLDRFEVGEFWTSSAFCDLKTKGLEKIRALVTQRRIPLRCLRQGDAFQLDSTRFHVLWPSADSFSAFSENNQSLVLRVCENDFCLLLTGDIEKEAEAALIQQVPQFLQAQVLKVAHHGSKTSSSEMFLNYVRPQIALMSAGEKNRFAFPHPEVLKRLGAWGIEFWTTSGEGEIQIEDREGAIRVETFKDHLKTGR